MEVPVNEVAATAAQGRNETLAALAGVFVVGFGFLFGLIQRTVISPVDRSVHEVESFSDKIDAVVSCSKDLVIAADQQQSACQQTSSDLSSGDADLANVSESLKALAASADSNAMKAEEAAVYCGKLDKSFIGLKGRLQKMLGRSRGATEQS